MKENITPDAIKTILNSQLKQNEFQNIEYVLMEGHTYPDLFKGITGNNDFFAIKLRQKSESIRNSLKYLNALNDSENLILKYKNTIETENYYIFISEWLKGIQPIKTDRHLIKEFFKKLAYLNLKNKSSSSFSSMYLDGKTYPSIEDMINAEALPYLEIYNGKHDKKIIKKNIENLNSSLGCIILEDMNTGNMFKTEKGDLKIIDSEHITSGLNLYQFEHINILGLNKKEWYNITDEAKEVLNAYFSEIGENKNKAFLQIKAFAILSFLRELYFQIWQKKEIDYSEKDKTLDRILNCTIEEVL
ncbi:hypothetical protein E4O03_08090 [Treponema sp. OMZ 792]|uniref:hypothetical protein n=1 Tax=unclassified Treponema TaxID=2638727 RepID=UPI0020A5B5EB|nr:MULTISPECIES: hypothetical protein [unclassified Treponema]UTC74204.1 hypothetical protein E4O03_08090 [Treponema sp. OMZ 792]UTC80601.1 hypothetical protein E4O07_07990 [Treponema sp. OMZ 798]